jgi:hypothetical protein
MLPKLTKDHNRDQDPRMSGGATTVTNLVTSPQNVACPNAPKPVRPTSKTTWTKRRTCQMYNKHYTPPTYSTTCSKYLTPFPLNRKTL